MVGEWIVSNRRGCFGYFDVLYLARPCCHSKLTMVDRRQLRACRDKDARPTNFAGNVRVQSHGVGNLTRLAFFASRGMQTRVTKGICRLR